MTMQRRYRRGDTGPAVAEIRSKLVLLGLLPAGAHTVAGSGDGDGHGGYADAVFDDSVDLAVRHFQQQRAMTVDGIVGPETYRHLDEARWRLGDRMLSYSIGHPTVGDDVATLQQRLLDMGFDCGRVDGILGPATERALREFQRNYGLGTDGTCGPATFRALDRLARTVVGGQPHAMRESELLHRSGPSLAGKTVVIDPGHGGTDQGVVAHGLTEAEVVWDLARRLEGRLSALGVQAYLTRGLDSDGVGEEDRAAFANATDADLVISLHADRNQSPRASGVSSYYYGSGSDRYGRRSPTGEHFASLVQRELVARTGLVDGRTHGKAWTLLRRTRMPAVRIELGYLTNAEDAARLAGSEFRDHAAESIVVALQRLYLPPDEDVPTGMLRLPVFT
ncbi:N-acetylmuramoyl-L-alanine amidase [Embleya scabrispora]|uniref:N-acetylmuramoyl-L-alanine amidase n=1 Tax=Embleya scabrispora TaxID=159449 RepID=UPI00036709CA|nr:N-acetylmuramoyl-L-alanine amidase [Embleya scabrispora]MYS79809.1 N-acetylmuramoyl-L-alanine amidase [Streptomyces sp. SID5474]